MGQGGSLPHHGVKTQVQFASGGCMYAMSGSIDDAQKVFERMEERNIITWNIMICGLAQPGCGREVYDLLLKCKRNIIDRMQQRT